MREFLDFIKSYGIVGLAIAVIIGGKLNELVTSFVNDLLMPLIFRPILVQTGIDDIRKLSYDGILYGKFVGAVVDFLIIALVIFLAAKYIIKDEKLIKK